MGSRWEVFVEDRPGVGEAIWKLDGGGSVLNQDTEVLCALRAVKESKR